MNYTINQAFRPLNNIITIMLTLLLSLAPLCYGSSFQYPLAAKKKQLPRFASTRSAEVNARAGPGRQYPLKWRFVRRGYPLLVVKEYRDWRMIKDHDHKTAWVHSSLLSGLRNGTFNKHELTALYKEPDSKSPIIARVEKGAIGLIIRQEKGWVQLKCKQYKGWTVMGNLWGAQTW